MANYPLVDGTNFTEKCLFPPNVDRFAEDYTQIEYLREMEDLIRFNSSVKTPGVVAKKAEVALRLYPIITVQPNTLKITAGTGFTKNGSLINVTENIVIDDMTLLPNWNLTYANAGTLFLVLRKKDVESAPRINRVSGETKNTRLTLKSTHTSYSDTIVEWYHYLAPRGNVSLIIPDKDVIVLGRLSAYNSSTFGYTEKTDGRIILRNDEIKALEETGGIMQGDIDMDNLWNILNVPQWASAYWKTNGVPHNFDFIKLFSKTNATLFLKTGIKFAQVTGQYGLQFAGGTDVIKFSILPHQTPPIKLDFNNTTFLSIPENNLLYYEYSLSELGLAVSGGELPIGVVGDSIQGPIGGGLNSGSFHTTHFYNSRNTGTTANIARFPICIHYLVPNTSEHYIIFSNGIILKLNDEINQGQLSYYVRTDGANAMSGDLNIIKQQAAIILKDAAGPLAGNLRSGVYFKNRSNLDLGALQRLMDVDTGGGEDNFGVSNGDEIGDTKLWVTSDNNGLNPLPFIFKRDGRLKLYGSPIDTEDVITVGYGASSNGYLRKQVGGSPSTPYENAWGNYQFNGSITIRNFNTGGRSFLRLGSGNNYATNKSEFWNYGDSYLVGNVHIGEDDATVDSDVGTDFKCFNNFIVGSSTYPLRLRTVTLLADTSVGTSTVPKNFTVNDVNVLDAVEEALVLGMLF